jgi:hypothetical protein
LAESTAAEGRILSSVRNTLSLLRLQPDAKRVNVSSNVKLFEESTCANHDLDGEVTRFTPPLDACEGGCTPTFLNSPSAGDDLVVSNDDEGGDSATLHISMQNIQQIQQP